MKKKEEEGEREGGGGIQAFGSDCRSAAPDGLHSSIRSRGDAAERGAGQRRCRMQGSVATRILKLI